MKHKLSTVLREHLDGGRHDGSTTVFVERELTAIDPKEYLELFAGLRAMEHVPAIENIAPYDKSYEFSMWSITGEAKNLGPNARDLSRVGVKRTPQTRTISSIGAAYGWSLEDLRAAAQRNVGLERLTVIAAQTVIRRGLDRRIALGDSALGYTGLCNDAQIETDNAVTVDWEPGVGSKMLIALNKLVSDTRVRLKLAGELDSNMPAFDRFQILLPSGAFTDAAQTPASSNYPDSVLDVFMRQNSRWVSGVDEMGYLEDLGTGVGRAICYPKNPLCLGHATARYYTEEAPQLNGLNMDVPVHAATGGTVFRYPVAVSYASLANT